MAGLLVTTEALIAEKPASEAARRCRAAPAWGGMDFTLPFERLRGVAPARRCLFWAVVEDHPGPEVVRERLEPARHIGRHVEQIAGAEGDDLIVPAEGAMAGRHDVELVALVRCLVVPTDGSIELDADLVAAVEHDIERRSLRAGASAW